MAKNNKYFNYPIHLQRDLLNSPISSLSAIFDFAIVKHANNLDGNKNQRMKYSEDYFKVKCGNQSKTWENGTKLQNHTHPMPYTGIGIPLWFDFYKDIDEKTEFDLAVLAAFQGIKSILGKKTVIKTNKAMIITRMFGFVSPKEVEESPPLMDKYLKRYHFDKLMSELELNWNLKTYSNHIRGLYISFDLDYTQLARLNENGKQKNKLKELKAKKNEALRLCYANGYG